MEQFILFHSLYKFSSYLIFALHTSINPQYQCIKNGNFIGVLMCCQLMLDFSQSPPTFIGGGHLKDNNSTCQAPIIGFIFILSVNILHFFYHFVTYFDISILILWMYRLTMDGIHPLDEKEKTKTKIDSN